MRSHSFQSLFSLSFLLSASLLANGVIGDGSMSPNDEESVVVWVTTTVTTCPYTPTPPPPCSTSSATSSAYSSSHSGYTTTTVTRSSSHTQSSQTSHSSETSQSSQTSHTSGLSSASSASSSTTSGASSTTTTTVTRSSTSTTSSPTSSATSSATSSTSSTVTSTSHSSSTSATSHSSSASSSTTSSTASSSTKSSTTSSTVSSTTSSTTSSSTSSSTSSTTLSTASSTTSSSTSSSTKSSTASSTTSSTTSSSTTKSSTSSSTTSSTTSRSSTSSTTTSSSTTSSAPACTDYFLEKIKHQGIAPYSGAPSTYKVFRNVKDYGAKGDGKTDDTAAIQRAISDGNRCAPRVCSSSTTLPGLVYFPPGTYVVSRPIINYYFTQIIGNPSCMPVLKASARWSERWLIDGNPYQTDSQLAWKGVNTFWRQIRNFEIDLTAVNPSVQVAGIHWPTGQATSLQNIVFRMSTAPGNQHQGLFIEEGSGGFVGDLVFYGGAQGMQVGNQQFTMRNLTFNGCVTAIDQLWDWGWTYQGLTINNCGTALSMGEKDKATGGLSTGSVVILDSDINNTPIGVVVGNNANTFPTTANSLILENVRLNNVPIAVQGPDSTLLAGTTGRSTIQAWGQGHAYRPEGPTKFQGPITPNSRPDSLVAGTDYYAHSRPQYERNHVTDFMSIRSAGAAGDGVTDDTAAINKALQDAAAAGKIVYFDYGVYVVTSTIYIPPGSKVIGEALPVIISQGEFFNQMATPKPVVQVGKPGESGKPVEWVDMVISTRGAQAGAILIEWNLDTAGSTPSGMWEVHTRIGGFVGSKQTLAECPKTPTVTIGSGNLDKNCIVAFMSMHVTKTASNLYMENTWMWVADHDIEDPNLTQITIYAGRGLLIESIKGQLWLYGTSVEHHVLYEYQLSNTKEIVMGQIQTETAYYQPNPDATIPFPVDVRYNDPVLAKGESGWGLRLTDTTKTYVYGAGLYSFFKNYSVDCSQPGDPSYPSGCQKRMLSIERSEVSIYNHNTIGVSKMITVDGVDYADFADNNNGFVNTVALVRVS